MRHLLLVPVLALLLVASLATPALAHASFDVTGLPAGSTQQLTLRVPLERDAVNELVEVLVPGAFAIDSCEATTGWSCSQDATQEGDTVLTLSRDPDGPGDAERFSLTVQAPEQEGVYSFPTIQTYDDGEEVAWVGESGTDRPAPRIQVGDATTEVEYAGDGTPHTPLASEEPTEDDEPTSEPSPEPTSEQPQDDAAAGTPTPEPQEDASDDVPGGGVRSTVWVAVAVGVLVLGAGALAARRRR